MAGKAVYMQGVSGWRGDASLYKLDPPMGDHEYVIVSAVNAYGTEPETYIFPADEEGEATSMVELSGSYKGGLSHKQALENAGYEVQY